MNYIIRKATEKDLEAILEIVNYNILNTTSIYDYEPRTLAQQKTIFDDKVKANFPLIVIEVDGEVAGLEHMEHFVLKKGINLRLNIQFMFQLTIKEKVWENCY